jgi:(4-O-methyl)-D-glucuronate---lignin esterase
MGEFWSGSQGSSSIKLAASIAHTYGKTFVGAESFTAAPGPNAGRWQEYPYMLKTLGDLMYCQGLNRYIFHRYAMQPWTNRYPGMTMGQWGFHFERTETWWKDGKPWISYITHCQYMLQQGRAVADAAYFTGQSVPVEMRVGDPALPAGYDYDGIDADVLMHQASVQDHELVLRSGMRYHVLILPPSDRNLTPPLLRQLRTFVADGLTLVGAPPKASPSLEDYPECDTEVQRLAAEMWADCDGQTVTEHTFGRGKVVWGQPMDQVFASLGVKPDFEYTTASGANLAYAHRLDGDADIYFVSNQRRHFDQADCTFRVNGKRPELWDPQTAQIAPAPVWRVEGARTTVPLQFGPAGSIFVVFRSAASGDHLVSVTRQGPPLSEVPVQRAKLRILKAVYGAFPSGHGWMDVTANVKSLLRAGNRRIPASNEMAGADPAPNIRKEMRVRYRLEGKQHTVEVREGHSWTAPARAQILAAYYGKLPARIVNRRRTVDVTAKLAALVQGNELTVRAGNELVGGDPAYLVPKELRVEYSLDGVHKMAKVSEGDTLTLPETAQSIGAPPAYRIRLDAQGQPRIFARAPGRFTLTEASGRSIHLTCGDVPKPVEIRGAWQVHFPPGWKAPAEVTFPQLASWTANADSGVKYFSGTATYEKEIEIPEELLNPQRALWLHLGMVKDFAEVSLNGKPLGILWMPPFAVNITGAARPGRNKLEVKVTNLWPNRLIGDEQLPPDCQWNGKQLAAWPQWFLEGKPSPTGRLTFTTWHHWTKNDPLLESGLLGPVRLVTVRELTAP